MNIDKNFIKINMLPQHKYTLKNSNLRKDPSTSSDVITVISEGSKVELIEAYDEWSKVRYESNIGYIHNDLLSITKYAWSNLNLRKEPNTQSNIIIIIQKESRVEVIENIGDWSNIIYNDIEGYVFNYFLSDDGNKHDVLDYKYFYSDMTKFANQNNIKSPTNNLLVTDLKNKYTYILKKDNNSWIQLFKWKCTVGKPSTPTITGIFYIDGRKPYFGTDEYRVKYATRIKDGYYYHSVLYDSKGSYIIDGRLGKALSHGCIRLDTENAKWIYNNILDTTTVVIH